MRIKSLVLCTVSYHSGSVVHNFSRARTSKGDLCCITAPAPVAASRCVSRVADARSSVPSCLAPVNDNRTTSMSASVVLNERDVRRVVSSADNTALAVPRHTWSADFVMETIMGQLMSTTTSTTTSSSKHITEASTGSSSADIGSTDRNTCNCTDEGELQAGAGSSSSVPAPSTNKRKGKGSKNSKSSSKADKMSREATWADGVHGPTAETELMLAPEVAKLQDLFHGAADEAVDNTHSKSQSSSRGRHRRSGSDGAGQHQQQQHESVVELQTMFSQLLYDNYQQVDDTDVIAFCHKLMTDLHELVQRALQQQSEDIQGLCSLCGRDMPLTKHHLIPRDVHKDFKRRGFTFDQLQSGIHVCRPCHSAIHRAVPDNKELATHYRTMEDLRQHEAINKFSSWASKQRVSSKADTSAKHFKYRK